jgi:hypothetical protein
MIASGIGPMHDEMTFVRTPLHRSSFRHAGAQAPRHAPKARHGEQ